MRMRPSPRPLRRLLIALALLAGGSVTASALVAGYLYAPTGGMTMGGFGAPRTAKASHRQLVLAIDGLSWEAFELARQRGMFRRFRFAGRQVATYPSMSHPSWTEIIGTRRLFGARGNIRSVEARWFDLDAMRIADDPRQVIARQAGPFNYYRAFDYFFDPLVEPLMYFPGRKVFDRELREAERAILDNFTGERYVAFIGGVDAIAHTHPGELWPYLKQLDSSITRIADSLDARGTPAEMWIVSDHGNAGAFAEGEAERYLTPITLDAAVKRAGLARADTGRLERSDQVAVVTTALATMVNVYFADLTRRRAFAQSALRERAVDLVTWLEVADNDRYVVILGANGSEAHLRWQAGAYAYERVVGNPLEIPDSLASTAASPRWVSDSVMRAATVWGRYPDAPFRLVRGATKQVENAPDLIVSLRDGFYHRGDMGRFVRMVRTHGSLGARATLGVLASTEHPVPTHVRGEEVLDVMGIAPGEMLQRVVDLAPHDPIALVRQLAAGSHTLSTGRSEESVDASFLRRARPVVLSMDYFGQDEVREIIAMVRPDSSTARARSSRIAATTKAIGRADIVGGLGGHVDALLALTDSLDVAHLGDRVREAEARLRTIPELAPLAELPALWSSGGADDEEGGARHVTTGAKRERGQGAPIRRAAMALWTLPYFLDAALAAPESDSIPDSRDLGFATAWHTRLRARIAKDPTRVLDDTTLAPRVFSQVFAERKLSHAVEPATFPMLYDPELGDVAVVYIPGIYGELFDQEIWSRGLRAVHDRLGVRTVTVPVDGRCASSVNAERIAAALRDDTRRRLERGYAVPRYLMVGYSKGGIDATEALFLAPDVARSQVAALVSVATPHRGTPVAERMDIPADLLKWGVRAPAPAACDTAGASRSLWPATRAAFWSARGRDVASLTRYFSVSFVSDVEHAHPWMKLTKRVAQFTEPNDGVVALSSSRFPDEVPAVDLGVVDADHIAGRLASWFPQEAFLEALVVTVAELGALGPGQSARWRETIAARATRINIAGARRASTRVAAFPASLRRPAPLPSGGTGWSPERTFRMTHLGDLADSPLREMSPARDRAGISFRCDQRDMAAFRAEYEFYYDADNGGSEGDATNGFAIAPAVGAAGGRACHLATRGAAIKMTTVAFRFRPVDFPALRMRLRVARDVSGVDVSKGRHGKNDSAFKLWLILRDTRPAARGRVVLFGYTWASPDSRGAVPAPDSLLEAISSRRNVILSVLPEAWLVSVGGPRAVGTWQTIDRDLAADLRRAYPGTPPEALQVVGITLQSDSDESRGASEVEMESIRIEPAGTATRLTNAAQPPAARAARNLR